MRTRNRQSSERGEAQRNANRNQIAHLSNHAASIQWNPVAVSIRHRIAPPPFFFAEVSPKEHSPLYQNIILNISWRRGSMPPELTANKFPQHPENEYEQSTESAPVCE